MKKLHVLLIVILTVIVSVFATYKYDHRDNIADLNHDGKVNALDLSIVAKNWTDTTHTPVQP